MRVELNHAKNGFLSWFARSMKSSVALKLLVGHLHPLLGQRPGVVAALPAPLPEPRIFARGLGQGRSASEDAARAKAQLELEILRIVGVLRLVLGVQVVEVAEEDVEAVHGRQEFVAVAQMVLAELPGHIAERFE
jgi:hypothetical protein